MNKDPRHNLPPGTYRATVLRAGFDPNGGDTDSWLDYSLEGCGDWVFRIRRNEATDAFMANAATTGWFEFVKGGDARITPNASPTNP